MKLKKTLLTGGLTVVLSSASLMAGYTGWVNEYDGTSDNTLVLFHFNNTSAQNTSPNAATGSSALGIPYIITNVAYTDSDAAGKFELGLQSDSPQTTANQGYAQMGIGATYAPDFNLSEISVEFWYKPFSATPAGSGFSYLLDGKYSSNSGWQMFFNNSSSVIQVQVGNGTSTLGVNATGLTWVADTWYHLAFTYENGVGLNIFRDGENIASVANTTFGDLAGYSGSMRLGNRVGSAYASQPGVYDEFRVSNIAYDYMPVPEVSQTSLVLGMCTLALATAFLRRRRSIR